MEAEETCSILSPLYVGLLGTSIALMVLSLVRIFKRKRSSYCNVLHNGRTMTDVGDGTEDMYHSLHSLSIGHTSDKKSSSVKSWLKTVEDMNYIGTQKTPPIIFTNKQGSILNPHSAISDQLPLSNSRAIIQPAKFRVRRYSINSATAALSLTDNSTTCCNGSLYKDLKQVSSKSTSKSVERSASINTAHTPTVIKDCQTNRTGNWLITTVIVVSVSSNVFLFLLLIFTVYKT